MPRYSARPIPGFHALRGAFEAPDDTPEGSPALLPITDDDATIAAALEDVSIPTLMLSMVHMTGDAEIIRGKLGPQGLFLNEVQGFMAEKDKAEVRRLALDVIRAYRDGGAKLPSPPSAELIKEMMGWLVCTEVPEEYVPMLLEEMRLDGEDARFIAWSDVSTSARDEFPIVVIGCGQSGLLAGVRLKEAGIPFTIIEKNAGVGGTWWENTYPGCRVDVGNHCYCYSFEPSDHWSEFFAQQPELQSYFEGVMDRHEIRPHVRFETEVVEARWEEAAGTWSVRTRDANGVETTLTARAVISAVGQLNRAKLPDIPGVEDFQGPSFHSSQWDHAVDYRGKRVGVIEDGATDFKLSRSSRPTSLCSRYFNVPPSRCSRTRAITRRWAPASSGPCDTCRSTGGGTGSSSSGPAVTVA